jgi:hypothetical protein
VATEWPLEGHFAVGGAGLYVHTDCLGHAFTSRTTNYDLTIGLPQLDTVQQPGRVIPPQWTYGPSDEEEANERSVIFWGAAPGYGAKKAYPASSLHAAVAYRCRYLTTLTASNDDQFFAAADNFVSELDDWWTRFTSWVGILASQDFVRLGGYSIRGAKSGTLSMWTSTADGKRAGRDVRQYFPQNRVPVDVLELPDLEGCVNATTRQDPPPAEWLFIRDARSLLNAGDFRRAVIDACTAAELSVTALIDRKFDQAGTTQADREQQFSSHHGLANLIALHNSFRTGRLPRRLYDDVGAPRNECAHQGATSSEAEARAAILKATEVVELAYPLAGLVPIQIN